MKRHSLIKTIALLAAVFMLSPAAWAQRTISGFVRDASGAGIIGAGVVVQGTTNGSITASDGSFSVRNVPEGVSFEVTCLGYKSLLVKAENGMVVTLTEDNETLDETIVVAYGTTKKASFSGSASVVKADQLDKLNGEGFSSALQGLSAGVQVSNFAANPGSEARIQIRGVSSMSGKSDPLYVVDGMPYDGGLNSINPSDIESLTVLKDAAASSLYGSRAANGVVIITTKKGSSVGKPKVNFRAAWGTSDSSVPNPKTMADPKETLLLNWEAYFNDHYYLEGNDAKTAGDLASAQIVGLKLRKVVTSSGTSDYVSPFKNGIPDNQWVLHDGNGNPTINPNLQYAWDPSDWDVYGAIFSRKLRQDYGIDVSGASDSGKTNYFVSTGFIDDGGYMLNQYYKRYSFRANVSSQINDWLQLGGSVSYSYWRQNFTGSNRAHIYYSTLQSPWLRNRDNTDWVYSEKTGKRMYDYGTNFTGFFGIHPVNGLGDYWNNDNDEYFNSSDGHSITARYFAELTLPYDIKFRSSVNLDTNLSMNYYYGSAVHGSGQKAPYGLTVSDGGGDAQRSWDQLMSLTWNNILNWGHQWGDHRLDLMAGQESYSYSDNSGYAYGAGIMQINQYELNNTSREWDAGSARDKYALLSFLGKIDYNFANKYYLSASFRRDGSSRFHPDNRWGNFFSVGASWRVSNEEFMKNISWLDNMVIRSSYGTTGNDKLIVRQSNGRPGSEILYGYQGLYENDNLYTISGLRPSALSNPGLQWEKNKQFNVGTDFTIFKNISGTIEYYSRTSDGLLFYKDLPLSAQSGSVGGMNTNIGTLRNSGFEFTVSANAIHTHNFLWKIDANLSTLKNEIVSLPSEPFMWSNTISKYYMAEGNSLYDFYAPKTDGIDPETGFIRLIKQDGSIVNTFNEVNNDDYVKIGSALPKVYGALTNSFVLGGFDLSFMFYYSLGSYMYDYQYYERTRVRYQTSPLTDLIADRWRKPGDNATFPRLTGTKFTTYNGYCDRVVFKNDFVRLRNLTLGYTLPANFTRRVGIDRVRLYFSGDNLLTFGPAAKRYSDPETGLSGNNYNGNSETDNGVQGGRRIYMGGIQITL